MLVEYNVYLYPMNWQCLQREALQVNIPDDHWSLLSPPRADEHKFLLELACSTTMSPAYNHELFWRILDPMSELSAEEKKKKNVVFVVCGGVKVISDELSEYAQILDRAAEVEREWKVVCNGTEIYTQK